METIQTIEFDVVIELIPFIAADQRTAGARRENETHPSRLQFGFAPELEKLVHDKVESSADLYVILDTSRL